MSKTHELNVEMRAMLVDWMVEIQENFELNHETLYQVQSSYVYTFLHFRYNPTGSQNGRFVHCEAPRSQQGQCTTGRRRGALHRSQIRRELCFFVIKNSRFPH